MAYLTKDAMRAAGTRHITAQRSLGKTDRTISTEAAKFNLDIVGIGRFECLRRLD